MVMCYQLFYVGDEISDFKAKLCTWVVWGKMRNAHSVLVVETVGKRPLDIALCRWEVKVK